MRMSSTASQRVLTPTSSVPVSSGLRSPGALVRQGSNPYLVRMPSTSQLLSSTPRSRALWADPPRKGGGGGGVAAAEGGPARGAAAKPLHAGSLAAAAAQSVPQTPSRPSSETNGSRATLDSSAMSGSTVDMEQAISWAGLSDFEMREYAEKALRGSVAPKLLQRLSRRDIVMLLNTAEAPIPARPTGRSSTMRPSVASDASTKSELEATPARERAPGKGSEPEADGARQKTVRVKEGGEPPRHHGPEAAQARDKAFRARGDQSDLLMQLQRAEDCAAKLRRRLQEAESDPDAAAKCQSPSREPHPATADQGATRCRSCARSPAQRCQSRSGSPRLIPEHPHMPWPPSGAETSGEMIQAFQVYGLSRSRSPSPTRSHGCAAARSPSSKHVSFGGALPETQAQRGTASSKSRSGHGRASYVCSPRDSLV
mmetsp:Transcript_22427/g.62968  ORF Transcript_22427/g.62968 Transcript_22427/m.62968 type:complete len:428 (-) Transcript_22427:102-1385(-)